MKQGYKIFGLSDYLIPGGETIKINQRGHLVKKKELGHTLTKRVYICIYIREVDGLPQPGDHRIGSRGRTHKGWGTSAWGARKAPGGYKRQRTPRQRNLGEGRAKYG